MDARRVVITGCGPISAIGIGREDFWMGIAEEREGRLPPDPGRGDLARIPRLAECLDFFVEDYLQSEKTYLDRCSEFALAACSLALEDAGFRDDDLDHAQFGLALGTAYGCLDSMQNVSARVQTKGMRFASPMIFTHSFANSPASLAAIEHNIQGPAVTVCSGDTSAGGALQFALDLVRWGRAEVMLAGGLDALSAPLLAAIDAAGGPGEDRVPGEGGCLFVLEGADEAARRGADVRAEIRGLGLAGGGEEAAVAAAIADAGITAAQPFEPPETYGHSFGGALALDLAAALYALRDEDDAFDSLVTACDPGGRCTAAIVGRTS